MKKLDKTEHFRVKLIVYKLYLPLLLIKLSGKSFLAIRLL